MDTHVMRDEDKFHYAVGAMGTIWKTGTNFEVGGIGSKERDAKKEDSTTVPKYKSKVLFLNIDQNRKVAYQVLTFLSLDISHG